MIPRRGTIPVGLVMVMALAIPAAAQGPQFTEVVSGLNSPRGVAIGSDGTLYVAEAGVGGEGPCVPHMELGTLCFGASGTINAITDGTLTPIVEGLASAMNEAGEAVGPSDVSVDAEGNVWFLVGGPAHGAAEYRDAVADGAGAGMGTLYRIGADGTPESIIDLAAFESSDNPDAEQPGNADPDSNLHGLAMGPDGAAVADAGANDLLIVDADGAVSVAAVFPIVMQAAPPDPTASPDPNAEPAMLPMDPVPTSVAIGPDGAYYVGMLTGFPFPPGGASVYRVVPGEEPTVYGEGFTNVIDVEFGPDGTLYVLELAHDGLLNAGPDGPPMGGLWSIPPGGGEATLIASDGLVIPGGLAVAEDGTIYITTCTVCAGMGGVISLQP